MNTEIRTGQFFDTADGTRTTVNIVKRLGAEIVSVECQVVRDRTLVGLVLYTKAGYLAAKERAAEECVA